MSENGTPPNDPNAAVRARAQQRAQDMLGNNVDLSLGRNSVHDDIYGARRGAGGAGILFLLALTLAGGAYGIYHFAYQRGLEAGQKNLPPIVLADGKPIKGAPDKSGAAAAKKDGLNIYNVMQGRGAPEGTIDSERRKVESLIFEDTPFAKLDEPKTSAEKDGQKPLVIGGTQRQKLRRAPPRPELNRAPRPADTASRRARYMVQLAASRSRALARGAYGNLQKTHPALLGTRKPLILRVDLGTRGIYYRVNVPNFTRRNLALAFCANLKKRGQDCVVKKQPS